MCSRVMTIKIGGGEDSIKMWSVHAHSNTIFNGPVRTLISRAVIIYNFLILISAYKLLIVICRTLNFENQLINKGFTGTLVNKLKINI